MHGKDNLVAQKLILYIETFRISAIFALDNVFKSSYLFIDHIKMNLLQNDDELTAKHCYFRCSRPPGVDGIKIFDKDDQATKH